MAFGAAMSDGVVDATGAPTKPYTIMYACALASLAAFTIAGALWLGPLLSRAGGTWLTAIGVAVCLLAGWAWLNIATFPAETERALGFPLLVSLMLGPSLAVVGIGRMLRGKSQL